MVSTIYHNACEITDRVTDDFKRAGFEARAIDSRELIDHGEPKIAIGNICENINEFDIPIDSTTYQLIYATCVLLKMEEKYWVMISRLVNEGI